MKLTANLKQFGGSFLAKLGADSRGNGTGDRKGNNANTQCKQPDVGVPPPVTRPRVSFRDEDDLFKVLPALSNEEYDRAPNEDHTENPDRDSIYDDLIDFCEKEMEVHPAMRHTVQHGFLHGKNEVARAYVRQRCEEANNPGKSRKKVSAGRVRGHSLPATGSLRGGAAFRLL